jgi:hypothetical protein
VLKGSRVKPSLRHEEFIFFLRGSTLDKIVVFRFRVGCFRVGGTGSRVSSCETFVLVLYLFILSYGMEPMGYGLKNEGK